MDNKNSGLLNNVFWKFSERIAAQVVTTVVSIILARLLDPSHYGMIAMVMIFITIANVFVSDGFGSALIQKKDADALDFSSVLYFNVAFSVVLYGALFLIAPYIAAFYGEGYENLSNVMRVLGLRLILSAVNSVQHAYVSKHMIFKKFFWSTLFGTVISAIVGIVMAYAGFGVWALVAQYLTNTAVDTIVLSITLHAKPVLAFSLTRLKRLLGFGVRILGTNLLIVGYQQLRGLIIGKIYSSSDLAYYNKAGQFPDLIVTNIDSSLSAVLFPQMALQQDDVNAVKHTAKMSIRFSFYVLCPVMLGLAAVSKPFVSLVLTDKWLPCVPLMQWMCVNRMFMPMHSANMQAIKAVGRSDITIKLEGIKKIIELTILLLVMRRGVMAITIGMVVCSTGFVVLNAMPNGKLIGYSFTEQLKDIVQVIVMSVVMVCVVSIVGNSISANNFVLLMVQVVVGIAVYILLSVLFHNKEYLIICNFIKKLLVR